MIHGLQFLCLLGTNLLENDNLFRSGQASYKDVVRAVARTLIGGVYIHIFGFCPTDFF